MTERQWLESNKPEAMLEALRQYRVGYWPSLPVPPKGFSVSDRKLWLFVAGVERLWWGAEAGKSALQSLEFLEAVADDKMSADNLRRVGLSYTKPINAAECAYDCVRVHNSQGDPPRWANLLRCLFGNPWRPATLAKCERCDGDGKAHGSDRPFEWTGPGTYPGLCPVCGGAGSPWLSPDVLALARACYKLREGRACERCKGAGKARFPDLEDEEPDCDCPDCGGVGRVGEGLLDPVRLLVLADALEEAGCPAQADCHWCDGTGHMEPYSRCGNCRSTGKVPHPLLAHLRGPGPHAHGCWAIDLLLGKV